MRTALCSLKTWTNSSRILKWKVGVSILRRLCHLAPLINTEIETSSDFEKDAISVHTSARQKSSIQPRLDKIIFPALVNNLVATKYNLKYKFVI